MIGFRPSGSGFIDVNMVFPPSSPGGDSEVVSEDDEVERATSPVSPTKKPSERRGTPGQETEDSDTDDQSTKPKTLKTLATEAIQTIKSRRTQQNEDLDDSAASEDLDETASAEWAAGSGSDTGSRASANAGVNIPARIQ